MLVYIYLYAHPRWLQGSTECLRHPGLKIFAVKREQWGVEDLNRVDKEVLFACAYSHRSQPPWWGINWVLDESSCDFAFAPIVELYPEWCFYYRICESCRVSFPGLDLFVLVVGGFDVGNSCRLCSRKYVGFEELIVHKTLCIIIWFFVEKYETCFGCYFWCSAKCMKVKENYGSFGCCESLCGKDKCFSWTYESLNVSLSFIYFLIIQ